MHGDGIKTILMDIAKNSKKFYHVKNYFQIYDFHKEQQFKMNFKSLQGHFIAAHIPFVMTDSSK